MSVAAAAVVISVLVEEAMVDGCRALCRVTDAIFQFLLVWYYCTLTIREHILIVNGSRFDVTHTIDCLIARYYKDRTTVGICVACTLLSSCHGL